MGLIIKELIEQECLLGIWEITESFEELKDMVILDDDDESMLESFGNHHRKLEWLSVRALLRVLTGKNLKIIYAQNRKPLIKGNGYQISISHSKSYTSIMLSRSKRVGIDLEFMSHRISCIEEKFMGLNEYITSDLDKRKYHLYIHWCAKEALYKICDKQDIVFKDNIIISRFEPDSHGMLHGVVDNVHGREEFNLTYFTQDNYIIVYTIK